jgi:uncharacterized delta-60 repeat protein
METRCLAGLLLIALNCATFPLPAAGVADGFVADLDDDLQATIAVQADGKILIGGPFTSVAGVSRPHLARLHPDGSLDLSFNPAPNDQVRSITVQPDGRILVTGLFTEIAGEERLRLARLHEDGSVDDSFTAQASNRVDALHLLPNGQMLVGGEFTSFNGSPRLRVARLEASGTLDESFNGAVNSGLVHAIAVLPNQQIVVGGFFTSAGGQPWNRLARFHPDGTHDTSFNPGPDGTVRALVAQPDGGLLVGGVFNEIAGQSHRRLARFRPDGSLDVNFNPSPNNTVFDIVSQRNGGIVISGQFSTVSDQTRNRLARLLPDGTLDPDFKPVLNEIAFRICEQGDGKIIAGGRFTLIDGQPRLHCARFHPDGSLDQTLNTGASGTILAAAHRADGRLYLGGDFTTIGGQPRGGLARLLPTGLADPTFNALADGPAHALVALPDGKVLVGGAFTHIGGAALRLARLDQGGVHDPDFMPALDGPVHALLPLADGAVLAGGAFTEVNGEPRPALALLRKDGAADPDFQARANAPVHALARLPDGSLLIGGEFTWVNGTPHQGLARLLANGALDAGFHALVSGTVFTLLPLDNGQVLVGGDFATINGVNTGGLARLEANGSVDPSFSPQPNGVVRALARQSNGAVICAGDFTEIAGGIHPRVVRLLDDGSVDETLDAGADDAARTLLLQDDGKLLAGGDFANLGGQPRARLARVANGSATRRLSQSQNGLLLSLHRTGTGPRLAEVWFEIETPGSGWQPLGAGIEAGGQWSLRTTTLPRAGFCRVRALGRPASSQGGSLHETVTQLHLPPLNGPALALEHLQGDLDEEEGMPLFSAVDGLDFGVVPPTTLSTRRLRLRNLGSEPLQLTAITLSDTRFSFLEEPSLDPLPPGESRDVTLRFSPQVDGVVTGLLTVASDDIWGSPFELKLSGFGQTSTNVLLLALNASDGALEPAFNPVTTAYTLNLPFETSSITVTPLAASEVATIRFNGVVTPSGAPGPPISLPVGTRALHWEVTAQDGVSKLTYTLEVTRQERFAPVIPTGARVARNLNVNVHGIWTVLSVSGLPSGLRYDPATGLITGRPRRAGAVSIRVRVRDADGRIRTDRLAFSVTPLPASALGSFAGFGGPHSLINGGLGGWVTCQMSASGAASGRLHAGAQSLPFRGWAKNDDTATVVVEAEVGRRGLPPLELELTLGEDQYLTGSVSLGLQTWDIDEGWRRVWSRRLPTPVGWRGSFNTLLEPDSIWAAKDGVPKGASHARLSGAPAGGTRWSGRTAMGQSFSFSGFLGPLGETAFWRLLPRRLSSLRASAQINGDGDQLDGEAFWIKQPDPLPVQRLYPGGFGIDEDGPMRKVVAGGRWQKPSANTTVMGWSAAQIVFLEGGVEASSGPSPNMQAPLLPRGTLNLPRAGSLANSAFLVVRINANNGSVSGGFRLFDFNPERPSVLLPRPVRFEGLLVPRLGRGGGFFLLPQLAQPTLTTGRTSPVLSGAWGLAPPP